MPTIPFTRSPAAVTLGEAMGLAGRYWSASWERWVLAVVAVALASGLAQLVLGASLLDQQTVANSMIPGAIDPSEVPRLLAGPIAVGLVSLVADWFLYANAIVGLRGGEMPLRRVIGAGLRVLLVVLLIVPGVMLAAIALTATGVLGLLGIVVLFPLLMLVLLRLAFWTYAIFDGQPIGAGVRLSWEISRGAVLRILGWQVALAALSFGLALVTRLLTVVLDVPAITAGLASGVSTAFQAWFVIVMVILYESQRLRSIEGVASMRVWVNPTEAVPSGWGQRSAGPAPGRGAELPPDDEEADDRPSPPPAPPGAPS